MTAATPGQAAAHAFVTGCVKRGITASQAAVPPEGQLATVRGLWADVAQAATDAATEGGLHACGYTLADIGRFLEAEAAAREPHAAPPVYVCPGCGAEDDDEAAIARCVARHPRADTQPAPELAALREQVRLARQDRDQLRTAVLSLAAELENEAAGTYSAALRLLGDPAGLVLEEQAEAKRSAAIRIRKTAEPA